MPAPSFQGNYLGYYEFQRRDYAAGKLAGGGFHLDAAKLWAANTLVDPQLLKPYNIATRQTAARTELKKSLHGVLCKELSAAQDQLVQVLSQRSGPPDLDLFFTLLPSAWTPAERQALPEHIRENAPPRVELLPAVLRQAKYTNSLEKLAEAAEAAAARQPNHGQLPALVGLVALARGESDKALASVTAVRDRLQQDGQQTLRPETLLLAAAAVESGPTREAGREILERVFQAALDKKDSAAQKTVLELLASEHRSWLESKFRDAIQR
jgi:hypothetical protein